MSKLNYKRDGIALSEAIPPYNYTDDEAVCHSKLNFMPVYTVPKWFAFFQATLHHVYTTKIYLPILMPWQVGSKISQTTLYLFFLGMLGVFQQNAFGFNEHHLLMPQIYLGNDPTATATCNCLDNATTLIDGQFSEVISIEGTTGETWTITAVSGLFEATSPAPPAVPIPITTGSTIPESPSVSGLFELPAIHIDGVGFSITVSNGMGDELSIGNTCYYPDPIIVGLSSSYCESSLPITLTGNAGNVNGTGSFTINGQPATIFDPFLLGPGNYVVNYTFDAGDGTPNDSSDPACTTTVSQNVEVLMVPNIAINTLVTVPLGPNCEAPIGPDAILEGTYPCIEDYIVTLFDESGNNLGNTITSAQVGMTLIAQVTTLNGPFNGNGNIIVTDGVPPEIECPEPVSMGAILREVQFIDATLDNGDPDFIPANFACFADAVNAGSDEHFYQLNPLTVTAEDVYTFELVTNFGGGVGVLYQGAFDPNGGPCQNFMAISQEIMPGEGAFPNINNVVRFTVALVPNQQYVLLTTSQSPGISGSFSWGIYSDGNGMVAGLSGSIEPVVQNLFCMNASDLLNQESSLSLTGTPIVTDNCLQSADITFSDLLIEGGNCTPTIIRRTFTTFDNSNNRDECTQEITLAKPTTSDVVLPAKNFSLTCDEPFQMDSNGNPHPSVTGYPLVQTAFGSFELAPIYCNLLATFSDNPRVMGCEGSFQFIRRWFIFNDCNPDDNFFYDQSIRVGDFSAPIVRCPFVDNNQDGLSDLEAINTNSVDCTAAFEVPLPEVADNCSSWTVLTEVLTDVEVEITNQFGQVIGTEIQTQVLATIQDDAPHRVVTDIPLGCHRFRYRVTDNCGNTATLECDFCVEDRIEPVAVCDDDLTVALGGNGYGKVDAEDVDEGSEDNCGIEKLELRRIVNLDPNTCSPIAANYTDWGPLVEFNCCEVGLMIDVELQVTDIFGNQNTCWTRILVEDKARPICSPPAARTVACSDLPFDFDANNTNDLREAFGDALAIDNCSQTTIRELPPQVRLSSCGFGTIVRNFQAVDLFGNESPNVCQQFITIEESFNYEIKFPKDTEEICGVPNPDTLQIIGRGCDDFAVSVEDQIFDVGDGACYQIFRTYTVINTCEYRENAPRVIIRRDEDCDSNPGNMDVWVNRRNNMSYIDQDNDENNNFPSTGAKSITCDGTTNPSGYWRTIASSGHWEYTQMIMVVDNNAPEVNFTTPDSFCSLDNNNCTGNVTIPFRIDEGCSPDGVGVSVFVDLDADGILNGEVTNTALTGSYPHYSLSGVYPIGNHAFEVRTSDGCGNTGSARISFEVADCSVAAPLCLGSLTVNLSALPAGTDADGDGDEDRAAWVVRVNDIITSTPLDDCTGPVRFSINKRGEIPQMNQDAIVLTCDDPNRVLTEVYAWDSADNPFIVQPDGSMGGPNRNFCEVLVIIQEDSPDPCSEFSGFVAGVIMTEEDNMVESVEVQASGGMSESFYTNASGAYGFENLVLGDHYTFRPHRNDRHANGVSTIDLILINKHILGVERLDSPYKMIAADVNNSKSISILDVIQIRKLVLGVIDEFSHSTSWKFVDAAYRFPNSEDPWKERFPEIIHVERFPGYAMEDLDFVAVKMGDVNMNARANNLTGGGVRAITEKFILQVENQDLTKGETHKVTFTAKDMKQILGYQFTLHFDENALNLIDLEPGEMLEEQFGLTYLSDGMITISCDKPVPDQQFSIHFQAQQSGKLDEFLSVSSRITSAEAYRQDGALLDIALDFGEGEKLAQEVQLYQNRPNPFRQETTIGFEMPKTTAAIFSVQDISGRVLYRETGIFERGYHEIRLHASQIPTRGMLYYSLEGDQFKVTKKMVIMD